MVAPETKLKVISMHYEADMNNVHVPDLVLNLALGQLTDCVPTLAPYSIAGLD